MPFVKRDSPPAPQTAQAELPLGSVLQALSDPDEGVRWDAARNCSGRSAAVPALAAALAIEKSPRVRGAIVTALVLVGDEASVAVLLPYLRSPDAGVRAITIEALQALPQKTAPFLAALFNDGDSDIRILATELARSLPTAEATAQLCSLLERELHPNVCGAAVEVLTEVGTREALPTLQECARRFADTPFLPFAIAIAVARISAADS